MDFSFFKGFKRKYAVLVSVPLVIILFLLGFRYGKWGYEPITAFAIFVVLAFAVGFSLLWMWHNDRGRF